ncbi:MAG TPA: hypothetical protein VEY69_03630 [Lautropia sp.]|nr:hypothetical protein [Lautropia sp.]
MNSVPDLRWSASAALADAGHGNAANVAAITATFLNTIEAGRRVMHRSR